MCKGKCNAQEEAGCKIEPAAHNCKKARTTKAAAQREAPEEQTVDRLADPTEVTLWEAFQGAHCGHIEFNGRYDADGELMSGSTKCKIESGTATCNYRNNLWYLSPTNAVGGELPANGKWEQGLMGGRDVRYAPILHWSEPENERRAQ